MNEAHPTPLVGIVGGSRSDFPVLEKAVALLETLEIPCELRVVSAHRTPDLLFRYAETAAGRGFRVLIAAAGGAAHLPGMLAAKTQLPVIGVPIPTRHLGGLDSLLSIVQMPRGVPVATVAIGGAENAALLAAEILALDDPALAQRLAAWRAAQTQTVLDDETNRGPLQPETETVLERPERTGKLTRSTRSIQDLPRPMQLEPGSTPLSEVLRRMREEERW